MNILNKLNRDHQKQRENVLKKAEERHQEELVRLGISEEQYQEIKKQKERKGRIKEAAKGILACIGVIAVIVGAIAFFSSDFGEEVVRWVGVAIVLGILLIGIWLVCEIIYPALRNWNAEKIWKNIIMVIISLLVVALIIWIIGTSSYINPPIHERL